MRCLGLKEIKGFDLKTIRFAAFLLYRYYYNSKSKNIAYFRVLSTLVFLLAFHIAQMLLLINKFDLFPSKYGLIILMIIPLYLLLALVIKQSELKKMDFDEDKTKKGYKWLIAYALLSFCFTFVLAIYRNGFHGWR